MTTVYPSLSELKAYLGLTGTQDDALIASVCSNTIPMAEAATGRSFSVTSNVTSVYSTNGQASVTIADRPASDATRVITLDNVTMTEGTNVWLLRDRDNPDVVTTVQLRYYNTSGAEWYRAIPDWFGRGLDNPRYLGAAPNNLSITGTTGHPVLTGDVKAGLMELGAWLYWRAKGGVSSMAVNLTGTEVDLSLLPQAYQLLVRNWKIVTAVALV